MMRILTRWKCIVRTFATANQALHGLDSDFVPNLIISDYRLRHSTTGVEAIEMLKAKLALYVPAILITGDTSTERLLDASKSGYQLLHKPVSPGLLRETIFVTTNVKALANFR